MPLSPDNFLKAFLENGVSFFCGVPDSTFKGVMTYLNSDYEGIEHQKAPNEGGAIAQATGYFLATKKPGVVYLQNSGLGNAINPLTSLSDSEVYGIPMLLLIGWRGEPGKKDEPQHKKMGACMVSTLESIGVNYLIIDEEDYENQISVAKRKALDESRPFALIVRKGLVDEYSSQNEEGATAVFPQREQIIEKIVKKIDNTVRVFSTTGKTSRELFEVSKGLEREHFLNFYNVGAMGFVSSVALEFARKTQGKTMILDGDGAILMQMGCLATIGSSKLKNLVHVVIDNGVHESTGGQPTLSTTLDWEKLFEANGYSNPITVSDLKELDNLNFFNENGTQAIIFKSSPGSRKDLGRPTVSPQENKEAFMGSFKDVF